MDYNRKELVDWVRGIYQNLDDVDKQDALRFFPELAESENERIRKLLVALVTVAPTFSALAFTMKDSTDCLSYLEKQKEQKSIESVAAEITKDKNSAIKFLKSAGIMDDNGELAEMYRSEQKPAEWNEEDEKRIKQLIYDTEAIRAGYEKTKEKLGDEFNNELIRDCDTQISWLKSLPERFNFQPKQEWSKEEKGILLECISVLQNSSNWLLADKLSSLRPQSKAEWSEDDEQYLLICKNALHKYQRSDQWNANIISNWLEERLKSFRSSWKPSKEQMEALRKFFTEGVKALTQTDCNAINSIYLELKKL